MTGKGVEGLTQDLKASKWYRRDSNLGSLSSEYTLKRSAEASLLTRAVQNPLIAGPLSLGCEGSNLKCPPTDSRSEPSVSKVCHFEGYVAFKMCGLGGKSRSLEAGFEGYIHQGLAFSAS